MRTIFKSLWIALCVSAGFVIPDYVKGTFDRADVVVPFIAFGTALMTLLFFTKEK